MTEAHKVAREIEYDIWFIAKALGAGKEQYQRKSHVYILRGLTPSGRHSYRRSTCRRGARVLPTATNSS